MKSEIIKLADQLDRMGFSDEATKIDNLLFSLSKMASDIDQEKIKRHVIMIAKDLVAVLKELRSNYVDPGMVEKIKSFFNVKKISLSMYASYLSILHIDLQNFSQKINENEACRDNPDSSECIRLNYSYENLDFIVKILKK